MMGVLALTVLSVHVPMDCGVLFRVSPGQRSGGQAASAAAAPPVSWSRHLLYYLFFLSNIASLSIVSVYLVLVLNFVSWFVSLCFGGFFFFLIFVHLLVLCCVCVCVCVCYSLCLPFLSADR